MKFTTASMVVVATAGGLFLLTAVVDAYLPVDRLSDLFAGGTSGGSGGQQDGPDSGDDLRQSLEALEPSAVIKQRRQIASAAEHVRNQLAAERTAVANLTLKLASTDRAAAARIATLRDQLDRERARSTIASQELGQAREQIARGFRDHAVRSERQVAEDDERVTDRIRHAADPAAGSDRLPVAVRSGSASIPVASPGGGSEPPGLPASALQREASPGGDADPSASMSAAGAAPDAALPEGVEARVTVSYAQGSESAHRRALALGRALQARGVDAAEPIDVPDAIASDRVTYYYETDRASAEHVAALSIVSPLVRGRLPASGRIPRPGTIEIAVAD